MWNIQVRIQNINNDVFLTSSTRRRDWSAVREKDTFNSVAEDDIRFLKSHICFLRSEGLNWSSISNSMNVSSRHLRRWRELHFSDLEDPQCTVISDAELDCLISYYCANHIQRGECSMASYLKDDK